MCSNDPIKHYRDRVKASGQANILMMGFLIIKQIKILVSDDRFVLFINGAGSML